MFYVIYATDKGKPRFKGPFNKRSEADYHASMYKGIIVTPVPF